MSINEPYTSLENCDISGGEIFHTEDCTCTVGDVERWHIEQRDSAVNEAIQFFGDLEDMQRKMRNRDV